jgi:hypothetical protein
MIGPGAVVTLPALRGQRQENSFGYVPWWSLALIVAPFAFGATLIGLDLAAAVLMVVLATASASRCASLRGSLPLSLGLAAFCVLPFIRLLGLPLPLTGPWLSAACWSPASTRALG